MAKWRNRGYFSRTAQLTARWSGSIHASLFAWAVVLLWGVSGPLFHYSDTWQLIINTFTNIITFLMVFLIQHSQSMDTKMIQMKLDELISASEDAHNSLLGLEDLDDAEIQRMQEKYSALAREAQEHLLQHQAASQAEKSLIQ